MRRALITLTCVGLLLPGIALADLEEGTYAPDIEAKEWLNTKELFDSEYDEPVSLSELRGMVVVLYFWVSYDSGGESFMPLVNMVENSDRLGRRNGVFLMGVTEADRERVEEMVQEERLLFPIALESSAAEEYEIESFPRVVVVDPNGKIAFTGLFGKDDRNFIQKIVDVLAETPPTRTHPREVAEAERLIERAREDIRAGEYKSAYHAARNAYDCALTGDPLKTRCQDLLDLLEAIGRDKLTTGADLVDRKQFLEGVKALREVKLDFRGMKCSKAAKKRLKSLGERYSEVGRVLDQLQHEAEARGLLAAARDALWERHFGSANETLQQIIKDYGDTPVVADAKTILARMDKNQTIKGYVMDYDAASDCRNWIGQARSFMRIGEHRKAEELLRKVIDTYPDTKWAEDAYRILAELP